MDVLTLASSHRMPYRQKGDLCKIEAALQMRSANEKTDLEGKQ